jgi:hypothetical protein
MDLGCGGDCLEPFDGKDGSHVKEAAFIGVDSENTLEELDE